MLKAQQNEPDLRRSKSQRQRLKEARGVGTRRLISATLRTEFAELPSNKSGVPQSTTAMIEIMSDPRGFVSEIREALAEKANVVERMMKLPVDKNLSFLVAVEVDPAREYELAKKLAPFGPIWGALLGGATTNSKSLLNGMHFVNPTGKGWLEFNFDFAECTFDQMIVASGLVQTMVEGVESGGVYSVSDELRTHLEWEEALANGLEASLVNHRGLQVSPAEWLEELCYELEPYAAQHKTEFLLKVACDTLLYREPHWVPEPMPSKQSAVLALRESLPMVWEKVHSLPSVAMAATVAGTLGFISGFWLH
jgi:hypothetical protein